MAKKQVLFVLCAVVFASIFFAFGFKKAAADEIQMARGEVLRLYENRTGEWASSVLMTDSLGKSITVLVDPVFTLVRRGPQIEELSEITGGMKITVLYRSENGSLKASVIRIDGGIS